MDPHSLTNIERKVLSKAFKPKHNDISQKEDLPTFSVSQKLRQSATQGSQADVSQGFSISQSFQQVFFPTQNYDFSGISTDLDEDLSNRLRELVETSPPLTKIALPGRKLMVQELKFAVPMVITGTAGTILEVTSGSFIIDFSKYPEVHSNSCEKTTFCELAIHFPAKSEQGQCPSLFSLKSLNSRLELRDCFLTSTAYHRHSHDAPTLISTCISTVQGAHVTMRSCHVIGFTQVVEIEAQSEMWVEKCHFEECQGDFIVAHSPKLVIIEESVLERGHGGGIKVNYVQIGRRSASGTYPHTDSTRKRGEETREVRIEGCEIKHMNGAGVHIWSESSYPLSLTIALNHNKVSECKAEAVSLQHITLRSLLIASNDMSCNQGSGIWLQKVRGSSDESISLSFNRTFDSYAGYGIYLYDVFAVLDNNECFRNNRNFYSVGGLLLGGTTTYGSEINIRRCTFHTNGENGLHLLDFPSSVIIDSCLLFENFLNGLYMTRSVRYKHTEGLVALVRSQVSRNRRYGLSISRVPCEVVETVIAENNQGAVEMDEDSKGLVRFAETNSTRLRELVKGDIGGDWGSLFPEKKPLCNNLDCRLL